VTKRITKLTPNKLCIGPLLRAWKKTAMLPIPLLPIVVVRTIVSTISKTIIKVLVVVMLATTKPPPTTVRIKVTVRRTRGSTMCNKSWRRLGWSWQKLSSSKGAHGLKRALIKEDNKLVCFLYFKSIFEKNWIFIYLFLLQKKKLCVFRWFWYIDIKNEF